MISVSAIDATSNIGTSQITMKMIPVAPGSTDGLTVSPKGEETPTSPQAQPINWPALLGVIGGVVVVALLIFFKVGRSPY